MKLQRATSLLLSVLGAWSLAGEWPQWRGPTRDGVWRETGILEKFSGPQVPLRCRAPIGGGDRLTVQIGASDGAGILALDSKTGEERRRALDERGLRRGEPDSVHDNSVLAVHGAASAISFLPE